MTPQMLWTWARCHLHRCRPQKPIFRAPKHVSQQYVSHHVVPGHRPWRPGHVGHHELALQWIATITWKMKAADCHHGCLNSCLPCALPTLAMMTDWPWGQRCHLGMWSGSWSRGSHCFLPLSHSPCPFPLPNSSYVQHHWPIPCGYPRGH